MWTATAVLRVTYGCGPIFTTALKGGLMDFPFRGFWGAYSWLGVGLWADEDVDLGGWQKLMGLSEGLFEGSFEIDVVDLVKNVMFL